jgi:hypothetical protein
MRKLAIIASALAAAVVPALTAVGMPAQASTARPARHTTASAAIGKPTVVYKALKLTGGLTATVFSNGIAEVFTANHRSVEYRTIPLSPGGEASTAAALPAKPQLTFDLSQAPATPFVQDEVQVVLAPSVTPGSAMTVSAPALARLRAATPRLGALPRGPVPAYTSNSTLNRVLAGLGVAKLSRIDPHAGQHQGLDMSHAFLMRVSASSVPTAVTALLRSPQVAYAEPDWTVAPMQTTPIPIPAATRQAAATLATQLARHPATQSNVAASPASASDRAGGPAAGDIAARSALPALPTNFALQSSEQSMLNRPATDWTPAYEELEARYHQLPGAGEIITDVSVGDLDSAGIAATDPCSQYVSAYGPTTIIQNGQRYLDWPSMPLIPTWTADSAGAANPVGEVCGADPFDDEIGLDFSMMAPLPDSQQRAAEPGSGLTDLLGMAPGAQYRLVVPASASASIADIDEAFVAAAQQSPRPDVITASLGFGLDVDGLPSRYLEDDPITEALIATLVHTDHIVVSVSANDGLRKYTNAAVAPSGGAAATNVAAAGGQPTNLGDIELSTAPSADPDSGSIDAGGVTLDDVAAAPPQDPANAALAAQQAFPEVRWDGAGSFASGYGSRVNVSAPADNLISFEHASGQAADQVTPVISGGTSASAQEVGAAAAIVQQAARLTGDRALAGNPLALRSYLAATGTTVPDVPQADSNISVGPQIDVGAAVTRLLGAAGAQLPAGVARVAVAQRQKAEDVSGLFTTATDPAAISLAGPNQDAWITVAPDWIGMPAGASYRLYALNASGRQQLVATGPWARLLPDTILRAAGLAPSTQSSQAVTLVYVASTGNKTWSTAHIPLGFAPASGAPYPLAPDVAPVTTGADIAIRYDLAGQTSLTSPQLVVTEPGRMDPTQNFYRPVFTATLQAGSSGTLLVPARDLQGGGVYGVGIQGSPGESYFSDFAYTRVQDAPSEAQPAAPLLSASGSAPGHLLTIPYGGKFTVSWNVSTVPHATGALLEFSDGGPLIYGSYSMFNNPNGTIRDNNGQDSGSAYAVRLAGRSGQTTLTGTQAGLFASMYHNVRAIPLLASGSAAGEGSDMSTISMSGITPADGGYIVSGFGVSHTGTDGLLTSNQINASGQLQSSVETFDQATGAITGTVAATTSGDNYTAIGNGGEGIFAGDTGVYADNDGVTSATYDVLHPLASGTAAGQWTPSASLAAPGFEILTADDQQDASTAFLSFASLDQPQVFTSDVAKNTFGQPIPLASAVSGFAVPGMTGIAQDPATGDAVVAAVDFGNPSAGTTLISANLQTGAITTVRGIGSNYADGVAIDQAHDIAVAPEGSGIAAINLSTGSSTFTQPGGSGYQNPVADSSRGEFVVQELFPPGTYGMGGTFNNDALSAELVLNDQGAVVSRIAHFNFLDVYNLVGGAENQLNPGRDTAYTYGLGAQEIAPFQY